MRLYNQKKISPDNTYLYALNMVNKSEGAEDELQDEAGNVECIDIPNGYKVLGTVETPKKKTFLFLQGSTFKIWQVVQCKHVEILDTTDFTYSLPIKGEYRIINENQELLYFYDGSSPDRYFNISHPEYHTYADSFLLKPNFQTPTIRLVDLVESGGNLPSSAYSIKARYLDNMGNPTDWFSETLPYPISSVGSFDNPISVEGVELNTPTTKALVYKMWNLDTNYPFVEIAVNKYTDENTVQSFSYGKFKTADDFQVSITSINNLSLIPYETTTVSTAKYESSGVMLQSDNRLLRGNLKEKNIDWGKFQQSANNIRVNYVLGEPLYNQIKDNEDYITGDKAINYIAGSKSGFAYTNKSLMRDEVYAVGIVWIMKDGLESPVMHIPGRQKDKYANGTNAPLVDPNTHTRIAPSTGWDSSLFNGAARSDADIFVEATNQNDYERWQVYNTAWFDNAGVFDRELAYYECRDLSNAPIMYPDDLDCDGNRIYPTGAIRHCKTPDTTLEKHYGYGTQYYTNPLYFKFSNIAPPAAYANDVVAYKIVIGDRANDKTVIDKGILNTILEQTYNQNLVDTVTYDNRDLRKGYIQSMQFSHDNQTPKSYTLQTSSEFFNAAGGLQAFMCLPACSDTIAYQKENCEQVDDTPTKTAIRLVGYHSPMSKVKSTELQGTHIKWERELYTNLSLNDKSNENFYVLNNRKKYKNRETKNILTTNAFYRFDRSCIPKPTLTNRLIKNSTFIPADSTFTGDVKQITTISTDSSGVFNNKTQQEVNVFQVEGSQDDNVFLPQTTVLDHACTHTPKFTAPTNVVALTDTNTNRWAKPSAYTMANNYLSVEGIADFRTAGGWMSHNYVAIKRYKTDCYRDLTSIKYVDYSDEVIASGTSSCIIHAGDIFICRFAFRQTFYGYVPHGDNMSVAINLFGYDEKNTGRGKNLSLQTNSNPGGGTVNAVFESKVIDTFYESEINIEWREHNEDIWNNTFFKDDDTVKKNEQYDPANATIKPNLFYPKFYGNKAEKLLTLELDANAISRLNDAGQWKHYELFKNYYKLRDFYNITAPNYRLFPLKEFRCDGDEFPNRRIWSERANPESLKDNYRLFLANNYKDIEGNSSYITDLFEHKGVLYTHTNETMYRTPQTAEQLEVGRTKVTIGTGEYLSLPDVRLSNTVYNYAGQQGRFNRINTEYGVFFCNQEQGVVYNFGETLQTISDDLQLWFYNNLPSELNELFRKNFGVNYPLLDNIIDGVGIQSTIDYNLDRWILHKRDYLPIKPLEIYDPLGVSDPQVLYFAYEITIDGKDYTNVFVSYNDEVYTIHPFTSDIFENKSWTLSYDMSKKSWISYHTYQPNWMYQDGSTFYTLDEDIWKHDGGLQRTFYGNTYDARIEWQISKQREIIDSIQYIMNVEVYDNLTKRWIEAYGDFSKGFIYNTYQSTLMFDIQSDINYTWSDLVKNVSTRERVRRINGFRQLNTTSSVLDSSWAALNADYQGYEPYTAYNETYVQNYSTMYPLRDIYTNARMYFQKDNIYRMRWQTSNTQTTKSDI